jgi:hypothetical protein
MGRGETAWDILNRGNPHGYSFAGKIRTSIVLKLWPLYSTSAQQLQMTSVEII